ncbi:VOC family protein [Marinobacterium arenosum]|uniref:VOC family protein n=1 Tax=Marinobacterium arenosum TaxID=2862496 RepID=UPI001C981A99|nr:VOC family protein [Marinobacterium arenosum]MBY4678159.1 VOC family protein [Marinobacterium arenosum]
MNRPERTLNGMRHIAFKVPNLEACERFYVELLGMAVLFRPHDDLVYLTLGNDNLSLSRQTDMTERADGGLLDHFGFVVDSREELDQWYRYLKSKDVRMLQQPHDHRDGARSFYCQDPAGNVVQPLYHPALSGQRFTPSTE